MTMCTTSPSSSRLIGSQYRNMIPVHCAVDHGSELLIAFLTHEKVFRIATNGFRSSLYLNCFHNYKSHSVEESPKSLSVTPMTYQYKMSNSVDTQVCPKMQFQSHSHSVMNMWRERGRELVLTSQRFIKEIRNEENKTMTIKLADLTRK